MNCYHCQSPPDIQIPLLRCGCYVCSSCYTKIKLYMSLNCLICKRKLIRGSKLNKS